MEYLVYLDTRNSLDPTRPADATFLLQETFPAHATNSCSVVQAIVPNTVTPINSVNNTLVVQENGGASQFTAQVSEQVYTGSEFATELASVMTAASVAGITYSVAYNSGTKKLTITANVLDFRFASDTTATDALGAGPEQIDGGYSASFVSASPVRLDGIDFLNIQSSLRVHNVASSGLTGILARIPVSSGFGSVITYTSNTDKGSSISDREIDVLQMRLLDSLGRPYPLPSGSHVSYVLRFTLES